MSAVQKQEIVEALRDMSLAVLEYATQDENDECEIDYRGLRANCAKLISRIKQHGIAPPDGLVLVKDEPVCWAITGDGKFDEIEFGKTFEMLPSSVGYWTGRGYEATPLYAARGNGGGK